MAREQLGRTLDIDQRLGANARAQLDDRQQPTGAAKGNAANTLAPASAEAIGEPLPHDGGDDVDAPIEARIKRERFTQLALANDKAREEASARSGRYLRADDARREMGQISGRLLTVFDGAIVEFANAIAAAPPTSSREALRLLRAVWQEIRARQAKSIGAEAALMPAILEDAEDEKNVSNC